LQTVPTREFIKIMKIIDDLQKDPRPRWIEKLKGIKKGDYYRISWGHYRVIYTIEDQILLVTVVQVDGRDDSYKKLNKRL
jgi:mRNA interferase RelE/StbE